ncbi:30S ribosomal protein S20 [Candidatus Mycoplasma haematohominis]|uniref:30S ribosomal protein S20 n=1 Tax=Candidatus Mycoplasma haematohominis TaxID=1494318 RepID=A0A478FQQ5_9MOLU|nr:30S ribosomal protein S20 [Candidatus Mycoplasma haemohominis]
MPNILSSKKSLKKERARRLVRIAEKKKLKRIVREGDISKIYKILDSQVSRGIIKKNKCNRLKSRFAINLQQQKEA